MYGAHHQQITWCKFVCASSKTLLACKLLLVDHRTVRCTWFLNMLQALFTTLSSKSDIQNEAQTMTRKSIIHDFCSAFCYTSSTCTFRQHLCNLVLIVRHILLYSLLTSHGVSTLVTDSVSCIRGCCIEYIQAALTSNRSLRDNLPLGAQFAAPCRNIWLVNQEMEQQHQPGNTA